MTASLKTVALASVVAAIASSASAITVSASGPLDPGDNAALSRNIEPGNSYTYTFTANSLLRVLDSLSIDATGFSGGSDVSQLTFGYAIDGGISDMDNMFDTTEVTSNGATGAGATSLPGFLLQPGQSFDFVFSNLFGDDTVTSGLSFSTAAAEVPETVPLPAAGMMLLSVLVGGSLLLRRKAG